MSKGEMKDLAYLFLALGFFNYKLDEDSDNPDSKEIQDEDIKSIIKEIENIFKLYENKDKTPILEKYVPALNNALNYQANKHIDKTMETDIVALFLIQQVLTPNEKDKPLSTRLKALNDVIGNKVDDLLGRLSDNEKDEVVETSWNVCLALREVL